LVLKGESMRPRKAASAANAPTADCAPTQPSGATGKSR